MANLSKIFVILLVLGVGCSYQSEDENTHINSVALVVIGFREGIHLRHCIDHAVKSVAEFQSRHRKTNAPIVMVEAAANQPASFRRQAFTAIANTHFRKNITFLYNPDEHQLKFHEIVARALSAFPSEKRPQFFLFLDDSTELSSDALSIMTAAARDPAVAIVGAESRLYTAFEKTSLP